ncbi:MAG TPA: ABC transporter permease [Bryobacteraceae bacterium]|nr:ABC transporter permease [Bryobacteraceae bacterium]
MRPPVATRLYRRIALLFPHEFQMIYGVEIIEVGEASVDDIRRQYGVLGLVRLILDIAVRLVIEYLGEMRRDLGYALRTLRKSRGFAAVGILSLGLALGVTSSAASMFFSMFLRHVPGAREPDRLVMIQGQSYPDFERYREHRELFDGAAAFQLHVPFNVSVESDTSSKTERIFGQLVSPEYFSVLGINAARGRVFKPEVDKPGDPPAVFLSDRFWRNHLGADPTVIGRTIRVNGQAATIVGIGPRDFVGILPVAASQIFMPTTAPPNMLPELAGDVIHNRESKTFGLLFRLAPGVKTKATEAALETIAHNLDATSLDPARRMKGRRIQLFPAANILPIPEELRPVLFGFVLVLNSLIVAIACMNLANMQLARATSRRREVAIRLSVGASRWRLIRQLLTENIFLSVCGGGVGLALAYWLTSAIGRMKLGVAFPLEFQQTPDWHTFLFTFVVAVLAGIGFGLAPALAATRTDLASTLKEGALAQLRSYRRFGSRNVLMVCQVAGSLTLLLVTGFLVIGFQKDSTVDVAFDARNMVLLSMDPVRDGYTPDRAAKYFENLTSALRRVPGVEEAAIADSEPFGFEINTATMSAAGRSGEPAQIVPEVGKHLIDSGYFRALSVKMLRGREFTAVDDRMEASPAAIRPAIVNQTAASALFGASDPIGRRISEGSRNYEVVGLTKDLASPLSQTDSGAPSPALYLPLTRTAYAHPPFGGMVVMVRSSGGSDVMPGVRREIAAIDPNLALFNVRTLNEYVDEATAAERLGMTTYGVLGLFGLILAAVGLAGVTAYSVARRRKEIGIRMALGARKGQVLGLVMREGTILVLIGSALGFLAAVGLSRAMSAVSSIFGQSFEVGARDPRLIVGAPLLLASLAMLACYLPARRSARIDPLKALREE